MKNNISKKIPAPSAPMDEEDAIRADMAKGHDKSISVAAEFYRRQELHDTDCEDATRLLMQENGLNRAVALSVFATVMENQDLFFRPGAPGNAGAVRAEFAVLRDLISRGLLLKKTYVQNNGDPELADKCLMTLLGFPEVSGASSVDGIVKLMGSRCTKPSHWSGLKARVNKCLKVFQDNIPELPLLPGQRPPEARANMSNATKKGWRRPASPSGE